MKKLLMLFMVAGMFSIVACGPTEEEKAAATKEAEELTNSIMNELESEMSEATETEEAHDHESEEATTEEAEEGHDHEGEEATTEEEVEG